MYDEYMLLAGRLLRHMIAAADIKPILSTAGKLNVSLVSHTPDTPGTVEETNRTPIENKHNYTDTVECSKNTSGYRSYESKRLQSTIHM